MRKPNFVEFARFLYNYTTFRKESYKRVYDRVFDAENVAFHGYDTKLAHWRDLFIETIKHINKDERCSQIKENKLSRDSYGVVVGCYKKASKDQNNGAWSCIVTKNGERLRMLSGMRDEKYINLLLFALFYALKTIPKKSFVTVFTDDTELTKIIKYDLTTKLNDTLNRALTSDMNARYMDVKSANKYGLNALNETAYNAAEETYNTRKPIFESYIS